MIRVADFVAKFIYDYGVKHIFMVSGGGIIYLTDGLACNKDIEAICLHNEQAVSMAVDAYSRANEHFGVGYLTTGPGATHAITGVAGAWLDSTPCLFISGQVKRREAIYKSGIPGLRQVGVQEINILPLVESITKYSAFIDNPEDIRYHLEKAIYCSREGRPGPVWLDIPIDVQAALIEPEALKGFTPPKEGNQISQTKIERVVQYLKTSSRPIILAGQGVRISGAIDSLIHLVDKYEIPVVNTYLSTDIIERGSPRYVGCIGIKGSRAGNLAIQNSDLLIVLGSSLPVAEIGYAYDAFAREAKKIIIDIDLSSHKKNLIKLDYLIQGDANEFVRKLTDALQNEQIAFDSKWLPCCMSWKTRFPSSLPQFKEIKSGINTYYFIERLSEKLKASDVVVSDASLNFYACSQGINVKKGLRFVASAGLSTMGYSLPGSIGASLALGKRRTACLTGEGAFQQNIQELQTVLHYGLPIKIFVINNSGYLSIRLAQKQYFNNRFIGESSSSGLSFPDCRKIAKAYGMKFIRANDNQGLERALNGALRYDGPVMCEIMTVKDQIIMPTITSVQKQDGSMVSKPLEDMFPFLGRDELRKIMFIEPFEEVGPDRSVTIG